MNLIKKLRRQFIFLATLAIFIIVAGALGLINMMGFYAMREHCLDTMTYITQNGGTMPSRYHPADTASWGKDFFPGITWPEDTPEFAYQTRYFSLRLDSSGRITAVNVKNIVAFSEEQAVEFARIALASPSGSGFLQKNKARYGFMKTTLEDGSTLLVILDCTREFSDVHTFLSYSVWFGFFCIILYVLIFAFLSKRAIAPFVKNLENQKRFITNASHELKTPLAIISVNAEAMEMMNGKNQWTEGIIKQVRRMSGLISHLILLSKAGEATKAQLQFLSFPVKDMFARLKEDFDLLAKDQGKKLTLSAEDELTARSDEKYLSEILHILLDNAVKYCDDGGTILLSAEKGKKKDTLRLSVSNDYKDGKDVDYSRFFERFYRNDESHNSKKTGYGIGLSIARELSSLLSIPLTVEYKDGRIAFVMIVKTK